MQRKMGMVYLLTTILIVGGVWITYQAISQSPSFVRKISGLPAGKYRWFVDAYQGMLFVVDVYGNKVDITDKSDIDPMPPFYAIRIDPDTEHIVEEFTTKHYRAVAISAERESRLDSWLAESYDYWVVDEQSGITYALKPTQWNEYGAFERYAGVHVIDLQTRQVKKFLEISPTFTIALHPNRDKLYVMTAPKESEEETGEIQIYSTTDLSLLKTITYKGGIDIWDTEFTQDGNHLFCCVNSRGILVINTMNDQLESWELPSNYPISFDIEGNIVSLALSSDEREIYIALEDELERGVVSTIDIVQRKLIRKLVLSSNSCTSIAVVGEKLFAACLDGVYVIDIPSWRQQ